MALTAGTQLGPYEILSLAGAVEWAKCTVRNTWASA